MRVLFATTRGAGHFGPLVPFARACRDAGHDVLVAGPGSCASSVERAGLLLRPHADPSEDEAAPIWERVRAAGPDDANAIVFDEIFAGVHARAALPGMLATIEGWRADVVVSESAELSSVVATELLGIPHVRVAIWLAYGELRALRLAAPGLERLRRDTGLAPDPGATRLASAPILTLAPPSLEDPSEPAPPELRRFREPAAAKLPLPDWWEDGCDEPLVYVSFGSVAPDVGAFPGLYRAAIDALAELPVRLLVTIGDRREPAELGPVPANVRVERWVPQAALMPRVSAMVGHGGSGSTLMALAAGVPLALVPLFADQPENARRVAQIGAGVALDDPAGLATAVRSLLEQPAYRRAAGRVAAEIAGLPPVAYAVGQLEELAAADRGEDVDARARGERRVETGALAVDVDGDVPAQHRAGLAETVA